MTKPVIFLDNPIESKNQDIIGLDSYVEALKCAINDGAQMIAITSGFGHGKSSIVKLLSKEKEFVGKKIINISMWSLVDRVKDNTNDIIDSTAYLHKSFLFRLLKEADSDKSEFFLKKLNKRYGSISLKAENKMSLIFTLILLGTFLVNCFYNIPDHIVGCFADEPSKTFALAINLAFYFILVISALHLVSKSEIVYSYKNQNSDTNIGEDELVFLYNKYILANSNNNEHYIVVIEDLDRIDSTNLVIPFLRELRKYYINDRKEGDNKVTFIVNVSKEEVINKRNNKAKDEEDKEEKDEEKEKSYLKLFDLVINLPQINTNDYFTVLKELLNSKKNEIVDFFKEDFPNVEFKEIEEWNDWHWIINGRKIDIRIIKDRLNRAFILYHSLKTKFDNGDFNFSFNKCTFAAYLTTEYAEEFSATSDSLFSILIDKYVSDSNSLQDYVEKLGFSDEYNNEIIGAIIDRTIDKDYYYYFYDYPKNSKVYTRNELILRDAIVYGLDDEKIDEIIEKENVDESIRYFINYYGGLSSSVKDVVFKHENLYKKYLHFNPKSIISWISEKIKENINNEEELIELFINICKLDINREVVTKEIIDTYCVLLNNVKDDTLDKIRMEVCKIFSIEIIKFKTLFEDKRSLISIDECDLLTFEDAIELVDETKINDNLDLINYYIDRCFDKENTIACISALERFINSLIGIVPGKDIAIYLSRYIVRANKIPVKFEDVIVTELSANTNPNIKEINDNYVSAINGICAINNESISDRTLNNIDKLKLSFGFSEIVTNLLYEKRYYFLYFLSIVNNHYNTDKLVEENVINAVFIQNAWFATHKKVLSLSRETVLKCKDKVINAYGFLFDPENPYINSDELKILENNIGLHINTIIDMIPLNTINNNNIHIICNIINNSKIFKKDILYLFDWLTNLIPALLSETLRSLNFEKINISKLDNKDKDIIFNSIYKKYNSSNDKMNMFRLMEVTKTLYSGFEEKVYEQFDYYKDSGSYYINAINNCHLNTINRFTVLNLYKMVDVGFKLNENVIKYFYNEKKIKEYLIFGYVSGVDVLNSYDLEDNDMYESAIEAIESETSKKLNVELCNNKEFVNRIIKEERYKDFSKDNLLLLVSGEQTSKLILSNYNYGVDHFIKYLQSINVLSNETVEDTIMECVLSNDKIVLDKEVYDNLYHLIKGFRRKKYTTKRNKLLKA